MCATSILPRSSAPADTHLVRRRCDIFITAPRVFPQTTVGRLPESRQSRAIRPDFLRECAASRRHRACGRFHSVEGVMRKVRVVILGLAPLVMLSCSAIAPVRINAGDQCFRCKRLITDTRLAAEQIQGGLTSKYRAPGCMAKYLVAHPDEGGALFVTDYLSGKMIPPAEAIFVPVLLDRNTGETDYQAYKTGADASAAVLELKTRPVDWQTVLDRAR
jgi:hypothetical protein